MQQPCFIAQRADIALKFLRLLKRVVFSVPLKNVSEAPEIQQELITIAGKTQVPCLVINGKPLHESDDIIKWLKENWNDHDNT